MTGRRLEGACATSSLRTRRVDGFPGTWFRWNYKFNHERLWGLEQIADTSNQASSIAATSKAFNRTISQGNRVSNEIVSGMDESTSAVNDLAEQVLELQRLVAVMTEG
ncbi:MAG: hypothetical protein EA399_18315 [Desulfovibrionales bacterium]|nr:MAG: hypothetical protein EA399_18315 [Desulfovibrionales bacterium]